MLVELVAAYSAPQFREQLQALQDRCIRSGKPGDLLALMGPFVLEVQKPILTKYGMPPNAQGVELLKHAVYRRVAEGATRVEELANEARELLGITRMPDRTPSAEAVLAQKADEFAAMLGDGRPEVQAQVEQQIRARIAAGLKSGALSLQTAALLQELVDSKAPLASVMSMLKMGIVGIRTKTLRGDGLPRDVPVVEGLGAEDFLSTYVLPGRPVVIRGAFSPEDFPPMQTLLDFDYLRRRCGQRRVLVKALAHDDGAGRPVFVSDPELKLPLAAFLDSVEAHERDGVKSPFYLGKVPLRAELPEIDEDIQQAPACPQRAYGSCFGPLIQEGVFTYFGCGRNTTPVHFDVHENLMLCISGTKHIMLYPPGDARYLYPVNDFSRSAIVPFASFGELAPDLRQKFALVPKAKPFEFTIRAGDLFYLPACWWHCVEGSEERNMILNWWFNLHPEKKRLGLE